MAYQQKPNTGAVFANDKKDSDRHPDRKGDALLCCPNCGTEAGWWLSGWIKQTNAGKQFLSLAFKPKDQQPATQRSAASKPRVARPASADMDSEIPF